MEMNVSVTKLEISMASVFWWVWVLDNQCKGCSTSLFWGIQGNFRWLMRVLCASFGAFDAVTWVTGKAFSP